MTAVFKCWLIYIIYFACAVHSARFKGTFNNRIYQELSDNIDGFKLRDFQNANSLVLDKLENQGSSSVSITNFRQIWDLTINAIELRTVPKLENLPNLSALAIIGNGIKFISRSAFSGLVRLGLVNMEYNEIRSIGNRAFPSELRGLTLRCNKLPFFTDAWFQKPELITMLDLSGNQIEELHEGDFATLTKLSNLNLFNNRITTIGNAAFGYHSPLYLHLGYNNLSHISANMFAKPITLPQFRIDFNRLSFLSDDLLKKLNIKLITIDGSPWQCPCLRKLETWSPRIQIPKTTFKIYSESTPVCVVATSFANDCVPFIESELQQFYLNSLPTRPVNMCDISNTTNHPLYYFNSPVLKFMWENNDIAYNYL